jgi:TRAP-type mannitol/chloroaromatic compound transport system permease large subunit
MRLLFPLVFAFFLTGCGTTRTETAVVHEQVQTHTTGITPEGKAYNEISKIERVEKTDVLAKTKIEVPEIKAVVEKILPLASVAVPGLGGILGGIFGWATGTPDGALTASGMLGLVYAVAKRGLDGERNLKKKTKYLEAVVEGNSNFMQAHPEHADLLKSHQRSAQVDEELKTAVKDVRIKRGLV